MCKDIYKIGSMASFPVVVFIFLCLAITIEPLLAATCTIAKYSENDIKRAQEECTDITLNGIEVPSGVGLNLNLKTGTKLTFQGQITWGYFEWNGPLVNITGTDLEITGAPGHVLDGRGKLWWDGFGEHGGTIKPLFFLLHGAINSTLRDLNIINTPYHAFWIEKSESVLAQNIYIDSRSGDTLGGRNTNGFNIWTSNAIALDRITVYNQGDCVAIKSGVNIFVLNSFCSGGHGLSVGSVGGKDYNIVENIYFFNIKIVNSDNGVRIKTVAGATGSVTNLLYLDIVLKDIHKYGIIIEGDYDINTDEPTGVPTDGVPITDLHMENVTGTVDKTGVNIYVLVKNASNWVWSDIDVTGGEMVNPCEGIPEGSGISC